MASSSVADGRVAGGPALPALVVGNFVERLPAAGTLLPAEGRGIGRVTEREVELAERQPRHVLR